MKLKVIKHILLFVISIFPLFAFSQTFPYYHYTTKDGLVNSNVYYICQDKTGYIWFATNNGISRFDGNSFENFYEKDGLNSNSFTSIALGEDSTLYFANFEKGINTYKKGIFSKYEISPSKAFNISTMSLRNDTFFIKQNSILFGVLYNHIITWNPYESYIFKYNSLGFISLYPFKNIDASQYKLLLSNEIGLYELSDDFRKNTQLPGIDKIPVYGITEDKYKNLWLGCDGRILKYTNNRIDKTITLDEGIKDKVYKILVDSRGIVWFHPMNKGLYILKDNEIIDLGNKISIGKIPITHIYEDREGNVWVSTSGNGVFCFNNIFQSNYTERDGLSNNNINSVHVNNKGEKLIGTFDGLNILEKNRFEIIITGKESEITNYIREVKAGLENNYLICGSYNVLGFERNYRNNKMFYFSTYSAYQLDSFSFVFYYEPSGLTFINNWRSKTLTFGVENSGKPYWSDFKRDKNIYFKGKSVMGDSISSVRINEIEKTSDGALWVGTSMGLCKINGDIKTYYKDDTVLNAKINCIKVNQPGYILIAGDKGISVISRDREKIISLTKTPYFDFSSSTSIDADNENNIWIGNLKGLYRIPLDSFINGKYNDILYFNEKTALPSDEVHTVSYDKSNNELWAGTANGLAKLELNDLHKYLRSPPSVLIEKIILSDTTLTSFDNLIFKPSQNNIRIHYTSFNFNSPKSIKYEHKFERDRDWIATEYSDIDLFSQPPGKYNLLLRTVNINNVKGEITSLKFEILAPFWKTLWFYALLLLLLIVLIIYAALKRIEYIKNKSTEQIRIQNSISELRHQALSASMNPHFIFNTLNSIQAYMNTHNKEEANEYLVNFSRLIRLNLDLAGKTFIPLETEIYRLQLYLKYEKIRFEDMLNYKINIDENINRISLLIPNMILQPFVENSIWHGILHKEEAGSISINIAKENRLISDKNVTLIAIEIIDDGVGLEADKNKKPTHISKGISLIKERLKLLAGDKTEYEYVRIQNREEGIPGVKVSITLFPGQYKEKHTEESSKSISV